MTRTADKMSMLILICNHEMTPLKV